MQRSSLHVLLSLTCLVAGFRDVSLAVEPQQLTTDGRFKRDPVLWPDGKQITYTTVSNDGISRLMRLNLADHSVELVHPAESMPERELTVAADGSAYAYVNVQPGGQGSTVVVRDLRTSNVKTLQPPNFALWPHLAPDGNRIVFTINAGPMVVVDVRRIPAGSPPVKIAAETSAGVQRLTDEGTTFSDLWPRFSPDGRQIVFSSRRDDDFEIYVMHADGSNLRRLTNSPGIDAHPNFTADGKQIVFVSNRDENYEIYLMNLDGSNQRRLTTNTERDDFPFCHPDGKRLLLVSERKGRSDLYWLDLPQ